MAPLFSACEFLADITTLLRLLLTCFVAFYQGVTCPPGAKGRLPKCFVFTHVENEQTHNDKLCFIIYAN